MEITTKSNFYGTTISYPSKLDKTKLHSHVQLMFATKKVNDYKLVVAYGISNTTHTVVIIKSNKPCFDSRSKIDYDSVKPRVKRIQSTNNWNKLIDAISACDNDAKLKFSELNFRIGVLDMVDGVGYVALGLWQRKLQDVLLGKCETSKIIWYQKNHCEDSDSDSDSDTVKQFMNHMYSIDKTRFRYIDSIDNNFNLTKMLKLMIKDGWIEHCLIARLDEDSGNCTKIIKKLLDYKTNGLTLNRCEFRPHVVVFSSASTPTMYAKWIDEFSELSTNAID